MDESVAYLRAAVDAAVVLGDSRARGPVLDVAWPRRCRTPGTSRSRCGVGRRAVELLDGDDRVVALGQQAGLLRAPGGTTRPCDAFTAALERGRAVERRVGPRRPVDEPRGAATDGPARSTPRRPTRATALELFERLGWTKRAADVRHNLAWLAGRRGDLVEAFRRFDDAERDVRVARASTGAAISPTAARRCSPPG